MNERDSRRHRLFVGIDLDDDARIACAAAAEQLRNTGFVAKYETIGKLHATLAFLGSVQPAHCEAVRATLSQVAARFGPFHVELDKLGAFPHERRPRVIFIGARAQGRAFRSLCEGIRDAYRALGFTFSNDSVAHVTIARVKAPSRPLPAIEFLPVRLSIQRVTLFESLPDVARNTTRYESVATATLVAASEA